MTKTRVCVGAALVSALLAAAWPGSVSGEPPFDDGVPTGTVAFFGPDVVHCPPGWVSADAASGRLIVGVTAGAEVGVQVGVRLGDREDRSHAHAFTGMVELPSKSISGADGSNSQGAQGGSYPVSGASDPASTGLPFAQLFMCEKQ